MEPTRLKHRPIKPEAFVRNAGDTSQDVDDLGPLAELEGTWVGNKGWNIVALPSAGSKPEDTGKFTLLVRPFTETLTFNAIGGLVRNRGGAVDQFIGALEYHQHVADLETAEAMHEETGMFMYLDHIAPEDGFPLPNTIARSGTIPHGNSIMLMGNHFETDGPPPFGNGVPPLSSLPTRLGEGVPFGYTDPYMTANAANPDLDVIDPHVTLGKDIEGQTINRTTTLFMETEQEGGGILNVPFIQKFADTPSMEATFWIEEVQVEDSDQTFLQLQYSQVINIDFHKNFDGTDIIRWPHITINTMRKQ